MAISDPNAAMNPGVQYDQFGRPIVVVPNPNQPPALGVGTGLPNNQPVLMNPTQPTTNSGVLSNPMANNNRSFTQLSVKRPDLGINTNEMPDAGRRRRFTRRTKIRFAVLRKHAEHIWRHPRSASQQMQ